MRELLKRIGITSPGYHTKDGNYVIDFEDSNEFNKAFSRLDKSSEIKENEDASVINLNVSNVLYSNDEFTLNLVADFDQNTYKLVVSEIEENTDGQEDIKD